MNIVVPVSTSRSSDSTVRYALEAMEADDDELHLVYIETPGQASRRANRIAGLLRHARSVANTHADAPIAIETAHLASDHYLSSPHDHAAELAEYVRHNDIDLVVLDPAYSIDATDPTLQPLAHAYEWAGLEYEVADVGVGRIPPRIELTRFVAVFTLTFAFYLVVVASFATFDLTTGVLAAVIAGGIFRNVVFETTPAIESTFGVFIRGALFVPYLLAKILIANVQIAYLILHPALPIDPHLDRVRTDLTGGLSLTALANSLTLTPGTLTVDADRDILLVHSITAENRREVLTGERQRAIQFVYYGRNAVDPADRIDPGRIETVAGPVDVGELVREEIE